MSVGALPQSHIIGWEIRYYYTHLDNFAPYIFKPCILEVYTNVGSIIKLLANRCARLVKQLLPLLNSRVLWQPARILRVEPDVEFLYQKPAASCQIIERLFE